MLCLSLSSWYLYGLNSILGNQAPNSTPSDQTSISCLSNQISTSTVINQAYTSTLSNKAYTSTPSYQASTSNLSNQTSSSFKSSHDQPLTQNIITSGLQGLPTQNISYNRKTKVVSSVQSL